jgi:putative FmdB family regulatory protein
VPTYQYACTACDHRFEAVQSFSDAALTECPECDGRLRKVFSSVGVVFKGSGFYRTDSRSDGKGGKSSDAKSTPKTSDTKGADTKSSETKSAAPSGSTTSGSSTSTSSSTGSSSSTSAA